MKKRTMSIATLFCMLFYMQSSFAAAAPTTTTAPTTTAPTAPKPVAAYPVTMANVDPGILKVVNDAKATTVVVQGNPHYPDSFNRLAPVQWFIQDALGKKVAPVYNTDTQNFFFNFLQTDAVAMQQKDSDKRWPAILIRNIANIASGATSTLFSDEQKKLAAQYSTYFEGLQNSIAQKLLGTTKLDVILPAIFTSSQTFIQKVAAIQDLFDKLQGSREPFTGAQQTYFVTQVKANLIDKVDLNDSQAVAALNNLLKSRLQGWSELTPSAALRKVAQDASTTLDLLPPQPVATLPAVNMANVDAEVLKAVNDAKTGPVPTNANPFYPENMKRLLIVNTVANQAKVKATAYNTDTQNFFFTFLQTDAMAMLRKEIDLRITALVAQGLFNNALSPTCKLLSDDQKKLLAQHATYLNVLENTNAQKLLGTTKLDVILPALFSSSKTFIEKVAAIQELYDKVQASREPFTNEQETYFITQVKANLIDKVDLNDYKAVDALNNLLKSRLQWWNELVRTPASLKVAKDAIVILDAQPPQAGTALPVNMANVDAEILKVINDAKTGPVPTNYPYYPENARRLVAVNTATNQAQVKGTAYNADTQNFFFNFLQADVMAMVQKEIDQRATALTATGLFGNARHPNCKLLNDDQKNLLARHQTYVDTLQKTIAQRLLGTTKLDTLLSPIFSSNQTFVQKVAAVQDLYDRLQGTREPFTADQQTYFVTQIKANLIDKVDMNDYSAVVALNNLLRSRLQWWNEPITVASLLQVAKDALPALAAQVTKLNNTAPTAGPALPVNMANVDAEILKIVTNAITGPVPGTTNPYYSTGSLRLGDLQNNVNQVLSKNPAPVYKADTQNFFFNFLQTDLMAIQQKEIDRRLPALQARNIFNKARSATSTLLNDEQKVTAERYAIYLDTLQTSIAQKIGGTTKLDVILPALFSSSKTFVQKVAAIQDLYDKFAAIRESLGLDQQTYFITQVKANLIDKVDMNDYNAVVALDNLLRSRLQWWNELCTTGDLQKVAKDALPALAAQVTKLKAQQAATAAATAPTPATSTTVAAPVTQSTTSSTTASTPAPAPVTATTSTMQPVASTTPAIIAPAPTIKIAAPTTTTSAPLVATTVTSEMKTTLPAATPTTTSSSSVPAVIPAASDVKAAIPAPTAGPAAPIKEAATTPVAVIKEAVPATDLEAAVEIKPGQAQQSSRSAGGSRGGQSSGSTPASSGGSSRGGGSRGGQSSKSSTGSSSASPKETTQSAPRSSKQNRAAGENQQR